MTDDETRLEHCFHLQRVNTKRNGKQIFNKTTWYILNQRNTSSKCDSISFELGPLQKKRTKLVVPKLGNTSLKDPRNIPVNLSSIHVAAKKINLVYSLVLSYGINTEKLGSFRLKAPQILKM